jgi:hypothetical protein
MVSMSPTVEQLEIFYFAFGMLRQAIWNVSPEMKQLMLKD